jgi:hypothetical protein
MGIVISILDYRAERLQESLAPPHFDNIYDFLRAEYGDNTNEQLIEILASTYRNFCNLSGRELEYSIMEKPGKRNKSLRNF